MEPSSIRPGPVVSADNAFFWDGVRAGEVLLQGCTACGRLRHPPRPMCPHCQSWEARRITAGGGGFIYSYVVVHRPKLAWLPSPFVTAVVELDEGVRMVTNVEDCEPDAVRIGARGSLEIRTYGEVSLPQFVLDSAARQ